MIESFSDIKAAKTIGDGERAMQQSLPANPAEHGRAQHIILAHF